MLNTITWIGILIPLLGTALGSGFVFFVKKEMNQNTIRMMSGFAAGVMVAASFWSLLNPAIEMSEGLGNWKFLPASIGFILGIVFLYVLDIVIPHMHIDQTSEGVPSSLSKSIKMLFAITLHNIPEGMAVGIVFASALNQNHSISLLGAIALAIGIAIQNIPEGAIVSIPLYQVGNSRFKTFLYGVASGVVEPIGSIVMILFSAYFIHILPYFLAFAAGAMFYVVIEELIPEFASGKHSNLGTMSFALGFCIMMILDVVFG